MLDAGTVSVLRASCNSTEGWEKYKRSGAVASLEILLHAIYYPSLHRKIFIRRQTTFYSHHRFRWKYPVERHNSTVFLSTNSTVLPNFFVVAARPIPLHVADARLASNTHPRTKKRPAGHISTTSPWQPPQPPTCSESTPLPPPPELQPQPLSRDYADRSSPAPPSQFPLRSPPHQYWTPNPWTPVWTMHQSGTMTRTLSRVMWRGKSSSKAYKPATESPRTSLHPSLSSSARKSATSSPNTPLRSESWATKK